jgi:tetratricopeptide (TPR) repeat protein
VEPAHRRLPAGARRRRGARRAYEAAVGAASCAAPAARCLDGARCQATMRALGALALGRDDPAAAAAIYGAVAGPEARTGRAFALLRLGRAADALLEIEAALAARPGDGDALLARGLALADLGRGDDAARALRAFLDAAPDHVGAAGARARLAQLARVPRSGPPERHAGADVSRPAAP